MKNNSLAMPEIIEALIISQNNKDSVAFAACFDEQAEVADEGEHHVGRAAIKTWIEHANEKYDTQNELLDYQSSDAEDILSVNVSGNFAGSPIVLYYHLIIKDGKISRLAIRSN